MFNWIRQMPDLQMATMMMVFGWVGLCLFAAAFILLGKLWDKIVASSVYQCTKLKRENEALRKKLREVRQGNARR